MAEEDLVYGKNRHFFGGIEPSNMKAFKVAYSSANDMNRAKITAMLPGDTVIDKQTLCTVAGAVIRRKKDSMPKDEFDGVLVKNLTENETFFDEDVEPDETYYYAAYPYTTQGVYNRNPANTAVVTILSGYPPDNMPTFMATSTFVNGSPRIKLTIGIPANTQIDGEDANTVAGVVVRRSTTGYPVDESDGEFVVDAKAYGDNPLSFYDTKVTLNTQYYYSGFPYTTQSIYNRDPANRVTAMAVGTIPDSMREFKAKAAAILEDPVVVLKYKAPELTEGLSSITIPIRRKSTSYPTNASDGDLVTTVYSIPGDDAVHTFIDKDVSDGVTYYYRAFPTSPDGVVNEGTTPNETSVTAKDTWIFGVGVVDPTAGTNPSSICSYGPYKGTAFHGIGGLSGFLGENEAPDNANFAPAKMNFTTGEFDYGDWDLEPGTFFMPRPCVLGYDGNVKYYLDPNDYTKKEDGTPADITSASGTMLGNVMMEWPRTYVSCRGSNSNFLFLVSNKMHSGGNFGANGPFENTTRNGPLMEHMYTSVYPCVRRTISSKNIWQSVSGVHPTMLTGTCSSVKTIAAEATNILTSATATSQTEKWNLHIVSDEAYINWLLILMGRSTDTQSVFGCGSIGVSTQTEANNITTGIHNKKGLFWGSKYSSSNKYPGIKIFGMEDYWGGLGKLTGSRCLIQRIKGADEYGYGDGNLYSQVVRAVPWKGYNDENNKAGYLPANTFEKTKTYSQYGHELYNFSYIDLVMNSYEPGSSGANWDYESEWMSNQLNPSYIGNDFIAQLHGGDVSGKMCFEAGLNKCPYNDQSYGGQGKQLGASATTRYCDYAAVLDYPTASGSQAYIYPHYGCDKSLNTETLLKRGGAFYVCYSDSLVGTGVRLSFKPMTI